MTKYLLLLVCFLSTLTATAQTTEDEARDDISYSSTRQDDRRANQGGDIWYGAGAQLGFSSNQFSSLFVVGLSPILGYKINNFLSVGPRAAFAYNAYREENGTPDRTKINFTTWEFGAFARAKVFNPIFAHVEYSLINEANTFDGNGGVTKRTRAIPFAGGGINQGGGPGQMGFEILLLLRLSSAEFINDSPVVIRTGLNYNF